MPIFVHHINKSDDAASSYRYNKFVDCAFAANAEYLVSDDKHFKILDRIPFPQINLLKMEEFLPIVSTL